MPASRGKKDHVDLICSIGELAGLFEKSSSLDDFLQTAVSTIAWHMRAAVCSVYLYDEGADALVLKANQGLNPGNIGTLRLGVGEGLVGTALKELRTIREGNAFRNPQFKFIPGLQEEQYKAFLAVPITRALERLGVLVVQDPVENYFDENDARALQAIAAQLSTTIENAKLLMEAREREPALPPAEAQKRFGRHTPGAPGSGHGRVVLLAAGGDWMAGLCPEGRPCSAADFQAAVARTEAQLEELQRQLEEQLADVASLIFSAHLLVVKDSQFTGEMAQRIANGTSPADAIRTVVDEYARLFARSRNPRLREKVADVQDVGRRLLQNLAPADETEADYRGRIAVAAQLLPSDLVKLSAQRVSGLLLVGGGATAHIAILARALQVPMVISDDRSYLRLPAGQELLLDGDQGTVYVEPPAEVVTQYRELADARAAAERAAACDDSLAVTRDGVAIRVLANINLLSEIDVAKRMRADGVGLYRSEFPFIVRNDFPSEEEQYRIYRAILDRMDGKPVAFRTLDVGGDKMLSYFPNVGEANPFLGLRAVRFTLRHRDIFDRQLRALLRAGEGRELNIMFPLVSSLDEFLEARDVVHACAAGLAAEGQPHQPRPRLGAMIELPSAVEIVGEIAAEADFLSIGANDLVQYMLAVDRTNEQISDLYVAHHPAVLRALRRIVAAAEAAGKPVSMCGEMGADARMVRFLVGIGLRQFSVEVRSIPRVREAVRAVDSREAGAAAARILTLSRTRDIEAALSEGVPAGP